MGCNAVTLVDKKLCDNTVLPAGSSVLLYQKTLDSYMYHCDEDNSTEFKRDEFEKIVHPEVDARVVDGFKNFFSSELFGYNPEDQTWPIAQYEFVSGGDAIKQTLFACKVDETEKVFTAVDITNHTTNEEVLDLEVEYHEDDVTFDRDKFSTVRITQDENKENKWVIYGFDKHSNKLIKFLMQQVVAFQSNAEYKTETAEADTEFATSILASRLVLAPTEQ